MMNSCEETFRWSRKATNLLIKTRLQMDAEFSDPLVKKTLLWERISNTMKANNFCICGSKCDSKWRNMLQTYRKIKNQTNGMGSNWDFYHLIDKSSAGRARPQKKYPYSALHFRNLGGPTSQDTESMFNISSDENSDGEEDYMNFEDCSETGSVTFSNNITPSRKTFESDFQDMDSEPPIWLKCVLDHLEKQDSRAQVREEARWKRLSSAVDSLHKAEEEKLTALNKLTDMLKQHLEKR